jgi:hypothetical protein
MVSAGEIAKQETFTQASRRSLRVGENGVKTSVMRILHGFAHDAYFTIRRHVFAAQQTMKISSRG